jgi:hypothetical protein
MNRKLSLSSIGEGTTVFGKDWLRTANGSGGVRTAARWEGLDRNWRNPPDPGEKDLGAR